MLLIMYEKILYQCTNKLSVSFFNEFTISNNIYNHEMFQFD